MFYDDIYYYGRVAATAEDAPGTPTQSHRSPSILVYEDDPFGMPGVSEDVDACVCVRVCARVCV